MFPTAEGARIQPCINALKPNTVSKAIGQADNLLIVKLDITDPASVQAAVQAAV